MLGDFAIAGRERVRQRKRGGRGHLVAGAAGARTVKGSSARSASGYRVAVAT